jgi:exonuclease SbcD
MRFLHTADWHIGQLFHEYDRSAEHSAFLEWLVDILKQEEIDVLLVSGDIFDISNPAAASVRMLYSFLNNAIRLCPELQVIITAGNHDSASRLEAPKPLLESSRIYIVGLVEKLPDGTIDYDKLCIPVNDKAGEIHTWCLAIPFLRMGDYPNVADCSNPYSEGVATFYEQAYNFAKVKANDNQSIIALGHLHTHAAEISDLDKSERLIMGGVECVPASAFHPDIKYVALGHIHKAQKIGGQDHIRYSGSVLPMSFSELNYKHQVIVFDLDNSLTNLRSIEIPDFVPLMRIPLQARPLDEVLPLLDRLPNKNSEFGTAPYLEVRVLLERPEPGLRHRIESALKDKNVRLARIDTRYPTTPETIEPVLNHDQLNDLQPVDVFQKLYRSTFKSDVPSDILTLFRQVNEQVIQKDNA